MTKTEDRSANPLVWIFGGLLMVPFLAVVWTAVMAQDKDGFGLNKQPRPEHPVTVEEVPTGTGTVMGHWKQGDFVEGYRIETAKYVFVSGGGGLPSQEPGAISGPGSVPHSAVRTMEPLLPVADFTKAHNQKLTLMGDLQSQAWQGKRVVYLYDAQAPDGRHFEIDRRPIN